MLAFIVFPLLAGLTLWLLSRWTSVRLLPIYVTLPLFVSFFIPISIVALVPFDLLDDKTLDNQARLLMWRIIYWLSFALMWLILPVLQAYVESGYYDVADKLKDALKSTLKYHLIVGAAGIAGLVYVGLTTGLNFTNLKGLCIALSHSYGLVLVIWMLGQGLVTIPRSLWYGTVRHRLSLLYSRATAVHDHFLDAQLSYDDSVAKIMALEPIKTAKYTPWIDYLIGQIRSQDMPLSRTASQRAQPRDLAAGNLSELSHRYIRELSRVTRARSDWKRLLHDTQRYEALQNSTSTYVHTIRPILVRGAAIILASLSVIVAWSEIVSGTRLSLVDVIVSHAAPAFRLIIAILILGYMCLCVNTALTSMRIFNLYAIVPLHTDPSSLLFFAAYALRLTVPLAYNFLMLNSTQNTVFQEFLGKFINLTALGKYVNKLLPSLILLPIIWTLFDVSEIIKDYLGFGLGLDYFDIDDVEANGTVLVAESEGRDLVRRTLQGMNTNNPLPPGEEDAGIFNRIVSWFN